MTRPHPLLRLAPRRAYQQTRSTQQAPDIHDHHHHHHQPRPQGRGCCRNRRPQGLRAAGAARRTVEIDAEGERGTLRRRHRSRRANRIEPFCPHFGACGGCQLQHMDRPELRGLQDRPGRNAAALCRHRCQGRAASSMPPAMAAAGRRCMPAREGAGYMRLRSHEVHDIDACPILVPALARAPDIARAVMQAVGEADVSFTATLIGARRRHPHREEAGPRRPRRAAGAAVPAGAAGAQWRNGAAGPAADHRDGARPGRTADRQLPAGDRSGRRCAGRLRARAPWARPRPSPTCFAASAPLPCGWPSSGRLLPSTATSRRSRRWTRRAASPRACAK